jgi:hypothetical protein
MDKRLIFRYRTRTSKSARVTGLGRPSAALELPRLTAQGATPRRGRVVGQPTAIWLRLASKKSPGREAARARTADRHWWPGINVPRGTGDPSSRN